MSLPYQLRDDDAIRVALLQSAGTPTRRCHAKIYSGGTLMSTGRRTTLTRLITALSRHVQGYNTL
jgi:hypothetical protein